MIMSGKDDSHQKVLSKSEDDKRAIEHSDITQRTHREHSENTQRIHRKQSNNTQRALTNTVGNTCYISLFFNLFECKGKTIQVSAFFSFFKTFPWGGGLPWGRGPLGGVWKALLKMTTGRKGGWEEERGYDGRSPISLFFTVHLWP